MATETRQPLGAPLHELLREHARRTPHNPACIWYGHEVSFEQLDKASDALVARLPELGVTKGEPVALFMNNCPQYVMAHYGIQKLGAVVCGSVKETNAFFRSEAAKWQRVIKSANVAHE